MKKILLIITLLVFVSNIFAQQDSLEEEPPKASLWSRVSSLAKKGAQVIADHPEEAVTAGIIVGGVIYKAASDNSCERFDILIEYHLMGACVQNCGNVERCAASISKWECSHSSPQAFEKKVNSCSLE